MQSDSEDKRKHLELVQGVVNRMASNSFLFKGWSITIIAGISAFATKDSNPVLMTVPLVSAFLFWGVDAYYLMLEKAFRKLYKDVATRPATNTDFALEPDRKHTRIRIWLMVMFTRPILWLFYGTVILMLVLLTLALNHFALTIKVSHGS